MVAVRTGVARAVVVAEEPPSVGSVSGDAKYLRCTCTHAESVAEEGDAANLGVGQRACDVEQARDGGSVGGMRWGGDGGGVSRTSTR